MNKVLFLLAFFASFSASSQTFSVGDTMCNYNKPNYTFTIVTGTGYSQTTYTIDLDSDNSSDISFRCDRVNYPAVPSQHPPINNVNFSIYSGPNVSYIHGPTTGTLCSSPSSLKNMLYGSALQGTLNWVAGNQTIVYYDNYWSGDQCGIHTDTFHVAFKKVIGNTDTILGWLLLDTQIPSKLISYAYRHTSSVSSSFTVSQDSVCLGDSINLNQMGTGYFSGVGVKNNMFHATTVGNYHVYTSNGCANTATLNITVLPLPGPPQITNNNNACYDDSLLLIGMPSGGVFSGSGVVGDTLYSATISTNSTSVNYRIADQYGCSNSSSKTFSIVPLTYTMSTCMGSTFSLPFNLSIDTTFTGSGIVNDYYFDSNISGTGTIPIIFTSLCNKTATLNITVNPNPPPPQIINTNTKCCLGDKVPVIGLPSGGYFQNFNSQIVAIWDDTLFTEYLQPYDLFRDTGKVVFSYYVIDNNGCGSYVNDSILVEYAYSPTSPISSCPNTTFSLTGYPAGGTFSGTSVVGNTYTAPSSIGYDYGYYHFTYPSGCNATYTLNFTTYDCVGIEENIMSDAKILIYPNPSSDIIQLDLVNINTENSYVAKIVSIEGAVLKSVLLQNNSNAIGLLDLANGVYFIDVTIDNSVYRSKLVIIR